jgi:hypothetical protein
LGDVDPFRLAGWLERNGTLDVRETRYAAGRIILIWLVLRVCRLEQSGADQRDCQHGQGPMQALRKIVHV